MRSTRVSAARCHPTNREGRGLSHSSQESNSEPEPSIKLRLTVAVLMVGAAFGPYTLPGIRIEQMVAYGLAICLVPLYPMLRVRGGLAALLGTWACLTVVVALGAFWPPPNTSAWQSGNPLAGLDSVTLPLAVMIVACFLFRGLKNPAKLLRPICILVVVALLVNAAAAWATVATGRQWVSFWSSSDNSTAQLALTHGRVSGLINQPAEAGVLYAVASVCAIYAIKRSAILAAVLGCLFLGGIFTVSKVYILVGIPIILWQLLRVEQRRVPRLIAVVAVAIGGAQMIRKGAFGNWSGLDHLTRNLDPRTGTSLLDQLTAGRLGDESTLLPVVRAVLDGPAMFGFGGRGLSIAYDNAFVEALVLAGITGVALLLLTMSILIYLWRHARASREADLFGALVVISIVGSIGLPVLTANRVATILWLLLVGAIFTLQEQAHRRPGAYRSNAARQRQSAPRKRYSRPPVGREGAERWSHLRTAHLTWTNLDPDAQRPRAAGRTP